MTAPHALSNALPRRRAARRCGWPVVLGSALLGTGCAGFNAMQASVSQLDEAAHTADDAEVALLTAYRTSECRNANLDRVFASIERHSPDLRLSVACTYVAVSDADLKIRATLLATIALYADKLQALAGDGSTGTLTTNSESVAKSINSFGTSSGLSRLQITSGTDAKVAKGVEAAVIELTGFVLEHKKYKAIQDAARREQPSLEIVVDRLKDENTVIGQALQNNLNGIKGTLQLALAKEKHDKSPSLFFDIVDAQELLSGYDAILSNAGAPPGEASPAAPAKAAADTAQPVCGPWAAAAPKATPSAGGSPAAKPLNDILDSIVAANLALTESRPAGIAEAAHWIESCGKSVSTVYNSLNK